MTTGPVSMTPKRFGRGGLLSMSVFLTASSPGFRTSPVKRGYWVVRKLLGERYRRRLPSSPSFRRMRRRRASTVCRNFWPRIAPTRNVRAATSASTRSGWSSRASARSANGAIATWQPAGRNQSHVSRRQQGEGVEIAAYIAERREDDFVENLCRKLLVYALGRGLILSDEPMIRAMRDRARCRGPPFRQL